MSKNRESKHRKVEGHCPQSENGAENSATPLHGMPAPGQLVVVAADLAGENAALQQPLVDKGLRVVLAANGTEVLRLCQSERPALVILDLDTQGMDGVELVRALHNKHGTKRPLILVASRRDAEIDQLLALSLGADAYVVKPCSARLLLTRVDAMLRTHRPSDVHGVFRHKGIRLDLRKHLVTINGQRVDLAPVEYGLLLAFLRSPRRTFRRIDLISATDPHIGAARERTVDVRISSLRNKLKAVSNVDPIETVRGIGYRLKE